MKNNSIIIFIVIFFISIGNITAQEFKKNELNIGLGVWNTNNTIYAYKDAFSKSFQVNGREFKNRTSSPVIHAGYKRWVGKNIGIGLTFAAGTGTSQLHENNVSIGNINRSYMSIDGELIINYIDKDFFKVYVLLGSGILLTNQKYAPSGGSNVSSSHSNFDFQITPIGVKLGRNIGFFGELGFGYKGVISGGLFLKI